jgi:hypothetical protein
VCEEEKYEEYCEEKTWKKIENKVNIVVIML